MGIPVCGNLCYNGQERDTPAVTESGGMGMELRELRTFVLATQVGSFSKVADILYTTQPSVSKLISSLEKQLGQPLFLRQPHSLVLTDFGRAFLPYAEEIIQAEINAMTFLTAQESRPSVFLTIGVAESCGTVPDSNLARGLNLAVERFRRKHEEVSVSFDLAVDRDLLRMIRSGKCDLALCPMAAFGDNAAAFNDLPRQVVRESRNSLIWSEKLCEEAEADTLLQHAQAICFINDLASLDLVSLLMAERTASLQHRIIHNWYGLLSDVLSGGSIGLIPEALEPLARECGLHLQPLSRDVFRTDLCLFRAQKPEHDRYVLELSDYLCES